MQNALGFTLVELVSTIAVAAVLVSVAAPTFQSVLAGWRLSNVTNELVAAVHLARSEAVRTNNNVSLCRAANAAATACNGGGTWTHWIVVGNGNVIRRGSFESFGAIRVSSGFTGDTLTFNPDGMPTVTNTITVCTTANIDNNVRTISIGPGNRVSIDIDRDGGDCP